MSYFGSEKIVEGLHEICILKYGAFILQFTVMCFTRKRTMFHNGCSVISVSLGDSPCGVTHSHAQATYPV